MRKDILIPQCWEEMTPKQFKHLLKLLFELINNKQIGVKDLLRSYSHYLCGTPIYIRPKRNEAYMVLLNDISNRMEWIFKLEDDVLILNYNTTLNLIPRLGSLVGPLSHGSDLRFGEYRIACEFYNKYTIDKDIRYLNALVGILYRKPNKNVGSELFDGDYREPFNKYHIEKYANSVKNIPEHIKWGIYQWFSFFCKYLMTENFIIEGNTVCFASVFDYQADNDSKKDDSIGMISVLFSLAESGTFGTIKDTDNAFLFEVLLKLLSDKQQADKLKRMQK